VPNCIRNGYPVFSVKAVGVGCAGVDIEFDGRRGAVKELGENGFEVFNRFLYHIREAAETIVRYEI
jgi:hypothetical protein